MSLIVANTTVFADELFYFPDFMSVYIWHLSSKHETFSQCRFNTRSL